MGPHYLHFNHMRYVDADFANLQAIFADRKQKSFELVKISTCKILAF